MRKRWTKIHPWTGLILGLWLPLIGLTGSLLVFYQIYASMPACRKTRNLVRLFIRAQLASSWWGRYTVATGQDAELWYVFVDPYTAQVLAHWRVKGDGQWFRREFSDFIYDVGRRIVVKVGLKNGRHVILWNHYRCHDTRPENNHT